MATTDPRLREKYRHFRILVIGRANAGKTTLLKRVCNTTEEPCIYDEEGNNLLEPTAERGVHDVRRPFGFANNPEFIFHDSPGFENGDERQLEEVQSFIAERARATEVTDQLHAIWFCFIPNAARPLLALEERFFNEARQGNVPVVAIFTKFDDLITQVYDKKFDDDMNRRSAENELRKKFRTPLEGFEFPPRAYVCMEDLHDDDSDHQDQVKVLLTETADSLDDIALKILFVSVQQNNLELCLTYAVKYLDPQKNMDNVVFEGLQWFGHAYYESYEYGKTENDLRRRLVRVQQVRRFVRGFLVDLYTNSEDVVAVFESKFNIMPNQKPPLTAVIALLLCAENSFWSMSKYSSFLEAFKQSVALYMEIEPEKSAENAVKVLGDWPVTEDEDMRYRSALTNILLEHRLPHPE